MERGSEYRVFTDPNPLGRLKRKADKKSLTRLKAVLRTIIPVFQHSIIPLEGNALRRHYKHATTHPHSCNSPIGIGFHSRSPLL